MKLPRRMVVEVRVLEDVIVRVRRPTWNEAQELKRLAQDGDEGALMSKAGELIEGIDNLEVDGTPVRTLAEAAELLDVESYAAIFGAVKGAGQPSGAEAGESEPQSSGAAST